MLGEGSVVGCLRASLYLFIARFPELRLSTSSFVVVAVVVEMSLLGLESYQAVLLAQSLQTIKKVRRRLTVGVVLLALSIDLTLVCC